MSGDYYPGDAIALSPPSFGADPATVTFKVRRPDASVSTYVYGVDPEVTKVEEGVYVCDLPAQGAAGVGEYRWNAVATEPAIEYAGTFVIDASVVDEPSSDPPGPVLGPGVQWITGEDVAGCCGLDYGSNSSVLDTAALEASMALYEISGRRFPGLIERAVRPCRTDCGCWSASSGGPWWWGTWPFGTAAYSWSGWGWYSEGGDRLGCAPMSRVKLSGYPVRQIVRVLVNGEEVPELDGDGNPNWRLDGWRYLTRMNRPASSGSPVETRRWPSCQDLSLDETQPGTFEVTYRWGQDPPQLGRDAASEIACQLFAACSPGAGGDCVLPTGVTKLTRQGVEVERGLLANWLDPTKPTGLVHVDLFLRAYWNRRGGRRSAVFSPDVQQFARKLGT